MRKLAKGPAIAAAVLSIFGLISLVTSFVNYLRIPGITPATYTTLALTFIATVLLVVVLFRRKADTFAAVVCFAHIPAAILATITAIISCTHPARYLSNPTALLQFIGYSAQALANLLKIAAFVMMALQCFRKKDEKSSICFILPIVSAVLLVASTTLSLYVTYSRAGIQLSYVIGALIGAIVGSIIGALPQVFTGIAFSKIRTVDQAPQFQAPLYQQYQMPQQQPLYQQYQMPQQPQYQQPQYQAPQYQAPQYQAPQYQAPQYQPPQYQPPQYQAPQYQPPQAPSQEQ